MRLGVGVGWHKDEFRFIGYEFAGRGRRADEALRLMRALWRGERAFRGEHCSFEEASFAPLPEPQPELWVGGVSVAMVDFLAGPRLSGSERVLGALAIALADGMEEAPLCYER